MTPALSFSELWKVRAILERPNEVNQTIRPLWRNLNKKEKQMLRPGEMRGATISTNPRLKVGDIVKLYYKQRSTPKDSWFFICCGTIKRPSIPYCLNCLEPDFFTKHFATIKITEVFEIQLTENGIGSSHDIIDHALELNEKTGKTTTKGVNDFAKRDGFESFDDLLNWFHKKHNLSIPKRFMVVRWEKLC